MTTDQRGIHRVAPKAPGFEVTAQMALARRKGRTLDCSTRVRTNLIMHRVVKETIPRECEWKQASRARVVRFSEDGQCRPVGLTKLAFSWKPIESRRGRYAPHLSAQREVSSRRAYTLLSALVQEGRSALKWATL